MVIDFHCHILPGFDDGSKNTQMSLEMLRKERAQGVDRVILTSHFYRDREECGHFLKRRKAAFEHLLDAMQKDGGDFPELKLGAEVAMCRSLAYEDLKPLCIEGTNTLLLELPFEPMGSWFKDVQSIINSNSVKVVLAHVERFRACLDKKSFEQVMALPVTKQINTTSLLKDGFFLKRQLFKLVESEQVHILGTDAHNLDIRPVNIGDAMEILRKKGMEDQLKAMMKKAEKLST
ncbi:MAG: capsular polysaccharide biosynthesis protein [Oscillospiraceae bacterium]|nr:capsular polysaccharide biosynthesis protein [Oscillospiraceae bacterium]